MLEITNYNAINFYHASLTLPPSPVHSLLPPLSPSTLQRQKYTNIVLKHSLCSTASAGIVIAKETKNRIILGKVWTNGHGWEKR
jgi:hypothetical protein